LKYVYYIARITWPHGRRTGHVLHADRVIPAVWPEREK
jgi:hypothetical protein